MRLPYYLTLFNSKKPVYNHSMKVVWITVGAILIAVLIGGAFFFMQQKPTTESVEMAPVETSEPTPTTVPEMVKYQNEAGFSFMHTKEISVKENELDKTSYADLTITSSLFEGSIQVKVVDTSLKDLAAWQKANKTISAETSDVTLEDLSALKIVEEDSLKVISVGDGVLYEIDVVYGKNPEIGYWETVVNGIVESWKFELPQTPTTAPVKSSGGGGAPASGGDIYEEETIE